MRRSRGRRRSSGSIWSTAASSRTRSNRARRSAISTRPSGDYTLYTTSQNPHVIRLLMGAFVLHIPEHKLRVVAPDVGGGFGSKIFHYAEEAIVTWARAARAAAGKVDGGARRELHFGRARPRSRQHGRDGGRRGRHLPRAAREHALQHGRVSLDLRAVYPDLSVRRRCLRACTRRPRSMPSVKAVFTNTVPVDAYRGAGRPEATFLLERLVDVIAHDTGMDRIEIRRRNFIPPDAYPYQTPVALQYDSGDHPKTLDAALAASRFAEFPARREEAARRGKLRGIGISTYLEACGLAPSALAGQLGARAGLYEVANVRVHPTGIGDGVHRIAQPRPGPRDDDRAARVRPARRAARSGRGRAWRHGEGAVRHGHLWQPEPRRSAAARWLRRWTR